MLYVDKWQNKCEFRPIKFSSDIRKFHTEIILLNILMTKFARV